MPNTFATLDDGDCVHFTISWPAHDEWALAWRLEADEVRAGTMLWRVTPAGVDRGEPVYTVELERHTGVLPTDEIRMRAEDAIVARIGSPAWQAFQREGA